MIVTPARIRCSFIPATGKGFVGREAELDRILQPKAGVVSLLRDRECQNGFGYLHEKPATIRGQPKPDSTIRV